MRMPRLNVNDVVYVVEKIGAGKEEHCKYCEGSGTIKIKDKNFTCPSCDGTGTYYRPKYIYNVAKKRINEILIYVYSYSTKINYKYDTFFTTTEDDIDSHNQDVFTNKERAEAEIKRRMEGVYNAKN